VVSILREKGSKAYLHEDEGARSIDAQQLDALTQEILHTRAQADNHVPVTDNSDLK
jgi:hypothetical protein